MAFIAITKVYQEQGVTFYNVTNISDDFEVQGVYSKLDEISIVKFVIQNGLTPINFSIDRNNKIIANCGDFARFSNYGSAVVLAELRSVSGRTLGYKLLSCAQNVIINLKTEEIIDREESYGANEHFLQNGIIRNKTVNCYPRKPFNVITIKSNKTAKKVQASEPQQVKETPARPKNSHNETFTPEQVKELKLCESNGVNPRLIKNSKLSPSQMRVLWVAKSKGAFAESFANPKLSTDSMKFYADRIFDKETAIDCKELLSHPELSVPELKELYACICEGVPYEQYIGKSVTDIQVAREMESAQYWGSSSIFGTDYYEKALNVARKIKGY
jgi:hypothetical protein